MVQLQLNQGPQDALLYDNTRSYFTNVGYVRTSNFQIEYRDVDAQNQAQLGTTVQYVIPKAADLLGPVDLVCELDCESKTSADTTKVSAAKDLAWAAWVDEVGFAMIEKVTFSVGSNDIETVTGEQMQLINELMKSDETRLGANHVLKTGQIPFSTAENKPESYSGEAGDSHNKKVMAELGVSKSRAPTTRSGLVYGGGTLKTHELTDTTNVDTNVTVPIDLSDENTEYSRVIRAVSGGFNRGKVAGAGSMVYTGRKRLIVPLGLFFTKHPSQYFPLAAVAGCNDVRISIKFRSHQNLIQMFNNTTKAFDKMPEFTGGGFFSAGCKLRCHYVHVTGPEATILMNKEHVRLLKLWHTPNHKIVHDLGSETNMDLSFLHPVTTLIITLRRNEEIDNSSSSSGSTNAGYGPGTYPGTAQAMPNSVAKGYFNYHGDGVAPRQGKPGVSVELEHISLTINGQERHPSLGKGIETYYLKNRLMPMLHSNTSDVERTKLMLAGNHGHKQLHAEEALNGAKNIFVFPFSLAPEGTNPSGAVNFSKVSHAKLNLKWKNPVGWGTSDNMRIDVHAIYYNWLQIKDGRALLSFA